MYLGCALLDAGKVLVKGADRPGVGGRPDLCVLHGQHRIWIEAIAPTRGEQSEDRIPEIIPINEGGGFRRRPVAKFNLRVTSALWTKSQVIARYRREGVIAAEDVALVAIGACRFGIEAAGAGVPLVSRQSFQSVTSSSALTQSHTTSWRADMNLPSTSRAATPAFHGRRS